MDFIEGNRVLLVFVFILTLAVIFVVTIVGLTLLVKKITHRRRNERQPQLEYFFSHKINAILNEEQGMPGSGPSEQKSPLLELLRQYFERLGRRKRRVERQALRDVMVATARNLAGESRRDIGRLFAELGFVDEELRDLRSSRWWIRAKACKAVSVMRPAEAIDPLVTLLDDKEAEVRMEAAMALVEIAKVNALGPLLSHLKIISTWMSLHLSQVILGMGSDAVADLIKGTRSDSPSVRKFCVQMLGAIGDISASEPLMVLARFADDDLKCGALTALGLIGNDSSLSLILECCRSDNEDVRKSAAVALGSLGAPEAVPILAELLAADSVDVRLAAGESLRRHGAPGEAAMRQLASTSDELGRMVARQFLELTSSPTAQEPLIHGDSHD